MLRPVCYWVSDSAGGKGWVVGVGDVLQREWSRPVDRGSLAVFPSWQEGISLCGAGGTLARGEKGGECSQRAARSSLPRPAGISSRLHAATRVGLGSAG